MLKEFKAKFTALLNVDWQNQNLKAVVTGIMVATLLSVLPMDAMAVTFDVPFITDFGCGVVKWMKGPLAILIFVVIVIATLVIGMINKMDWSRIIQVCMVFGVIIGLGSMLANSSYLSASSAMQSCLA